MKNRLLNPDQIPQFSLNDVARVAGVNPSVFRNWQRQGISFFEFEGPANPASGPGKAHKLSGRIAIYMLLSVHISKHGVSPRKAHEIALGYTHMSSVTVSASNNGNINPSREVCDNYSTANLTNLVICPVSGKYKYFPTDNSPSVMEMRNMLVEYINGIVHIDMNMFMKWARNELGLPPPPQQKT